MQGLPTPLDQSSVWEAIGWVVGTLILIGSGGLAAWRGYRSSARGGLAGGIAESLADAVTRLQAESAEQQRLIVRLSEEHEETRAALHRIEEMTRATAACAQRIEVDVARIHATVRPEARG